MRDRTSRASLLSVLALVLAVAALGGCAVAVVPAEPGPGKVLVCHKGKKTLEISEAALRAHLDHGDHRGPCR